MTPRMVRSVEELRRLPVGSVISSRLVSGEVRVATKNASVGGHEGFDWTIDESDARHSEHGVEDILGLPATILAPAIDPDDEALVEKVLDALAEDGLLFSRAHDNPRDVLVEANAQIVARAALKAVTR